MQRATCFPQGDGPAQLYLGREADTPEKEAEERNVKECIPLTSQETTCLVTGGGGTFSAGVADE